MAENDDIEEKIKITVSTICIRWKYYQRLPFPTLINLKTLVIHVDFLPIDNYSLCIICL